MAICNGSYQDNLGTAAWIIMDESELGFITRSTAWAPGIASDQCAFQSKLASIHSIIWVVNFICK